MSESEFNELTEIRIANHKAQKKKAPEMTQRIANTLIEEIGLAVKHGFTVDEVLNKFATRSWLSFQFNWIAPNKNIKTDTNNNSGGQYAVKQQSARTSSYEKQLAAAKETVAIYS